jgi:hypothetical protein
MTLQTPCRSLSWLTGYVGGDPQNWPVSIPR